MCIRDREEDDLLGKDPFQLRIDHGVTAVLDDDLLPPEVLDVGKRFDEHLCPVYRLFHGSSFFTCDFPLS
jgi:hypothetical protein